MLSVPAKYSMDLLLTPWPWIMPRAVIFLWMLQTACARSRMDTSVNVSDTITRIFMMTEFCSGNPDGAHGHT